MPREVQGESAEKWLSVQFAFYMLPRQYSPWIYNRVTPLRAMLAIIQRWPLLRGLYTYTRARQLEYSCLVQV